jgi:hypothetical protein
MSYSDRDRDIHTTNRPQLQVEAILDLESLDFNQSIPPVHKNSHDHHHAQASLSGQTSFSKHNNFRLRRFLLPAIFVLVLALVSLFAWSCFNGMPARGVNLMRRESSTGQLALLTSDLL